MYFNRLGESITFDRWCYLQGDPQYACIAWDEPQVGVYVSTVWLGVNHWYDNDNPLIFETIVVNGPCDQDFRRYGSEVEAVCGHLTAVERVGAGLSAWPEDE